MIQPLYMKCEIIIDENISFSKLSEIFELANKEKDVQLLEIFAWIN